MGTTLQALKGEGAQLAFVLVIGGYDKLITDWSDIDAVKTAWSGSGWSDAIPGLQVEGDFEQSIEPWAEELDVSNIRFIITPVDGYEDFGKIVFRKKPSKVTWLTSPFEASTSGGTVNVKSNADFDASGEIYIGNERLSYSSLDGTTGFVISAGGAGLYEPFTVDGGSTWPKRHDAGNQRDWDLASPPKVTTTPRVWNKRFVGLWAHRVVGGVLDKKSEAELLYAGIIVDIQDDGMSTILDTEDIRAKIRDTELLRDQFRGYIKEGIRLKAGDKFQMYENGNESNELEVVSSSPGTNQILEGYYDLESFESELNSWFQTEKAAARVSANWNIRHGQPEQTPETRTLIEAKGFSGTNEVIALRVNRALILQFLGFTENLKQKGEWFYVSQHDHASELVIASDEVPYKVKPFQHDSNLGLASAELTDTTGTWWNHQDHLPAALDNFTEAGGDYSFVRIGDRLLFVNRISDTEIATPIAAKTQMRTLLGMEPSGSTWLPDGLRVDEEGSLEVAQVVMISGTFSEMFGKIFASVEGNKVNHATYDVFPEQMGAGIPWGLLGDNFVDSMKSLEETCESTAITLFLDKPTSLTEVLLPELTLRYAWLIFKNGGLQFVSPPIPNASEADHVLDETNKGAEPGKVEDLVTSTSITDSWLRNVISVKYGRDLRGNYRSRPLVIRNQQSVTDYGESQPVTIEHPNSWSGADDIGNAIESLTAGLAARMIPVFGKPLHLWTRTINGSLFHVRPGDIVTLSDNHARDPNTGERGLSNRACTVLRNSHRYGHEGDGLYGEIDLLFTEEERLFPMSPSARVDESHNSGNYTNGWDATNKKLKLKPHEHSARAFTGVGFHSIANQYASISDSDQDGTLDLTGDLTEECWVRFRSLPASGEFMALAGKWHSTNQEKSYLMWLENQSGTYKVICAISDDGKKNHSVECTWSGAATNEWTHFAMSFDASAYVSSPTDQFTCWINGVSQTLTAVNDDGATSVFNGGAAFAVGMSTGGSGLLDGDMADVRLWDDVRTDSEISSNYDTDIANSSSNLVGRWYRSQSHLDEAGKNDLSPNGYPALVTDLPVSLANTKKDIEELDAGYTVHVVEIDPRRSDEADSFTDTLASVDASNDEIELTEGFGQSGNPDFNSNKLYRVVFDSYDQATDDQKLFTFQADDADGEILDTIEPNIYGDSSLLSFVETSGTQLPEIHAAEYIGDGAPLSTCIPYMLARAANNLQNYKTAPQLAGLREPINFNTVDGVFETVTLFLAPTGARNLPGNKERLLTISAQIKADTGSITLRVTTSRSAPGGDINNDTTIPGPTSSVEWTTSDTRIQKTTEKTLRLIPSRAGCSWIIVEATGSGKFYDFPKFKIGPLE